MFIQSVKTPNPNAIKFFPGGKVMGEGRAYDFTGPEDAEVSPMAAAIFRIDGVTQIFYGDDFVSVTKTEDADWEVTKPQVIMAILNYYSEEGSLFGESGDAGGNEDGEGIDIGYAAAGDDPLSQKIVDLLEQYVAPRLAVDGGHVEFIGFIDGIVKLKLRGACSSCPSATMTLKHGIKSLLMAWIPEVLDVEEETA